MFSDYPYERDKENVEIITFYTAYDTQKIRKSVCKCFCPWIRRSSGGNAECVFYDANGNQLNMVLLPNAIAYGSYTTGDGITISYDGCRLFLPWTVKNETACYSIETNEILWRCAQKDIGYIFLYGDKLYSHSIHSKSKGSLQLINANTGEHIKEMLSYSTTMNHPSFYRLSERYLLVYIMERFFVYDMETDELLITQVRHKALFDYELCRLEKVLPTNNSNEVNCRFADFVSTYDGRGIIAKVERQKSEVILKISDLLDGAKPSPFGNKIPTDKKTLEKAQ
jgi:hypothetical protein